MLNKNRMLLIISVLFLLTVDYAVLANLAPCPPCMERDSNGMCTIYKGWGVDCGDCKTCDGFGSCVDNCPSNTCVASIDFCATCLTDADCGLCYSCYGGGTTYSLCLPNPTGTDCGDCEECFQDPVNALYSYCWTTCTTSPNLQCVASTDTCVQCLNNGHCISPTPYCRTSSDNKCVECLIDGHCISPATCQVNTCCQNNGGGACTVTDADVGFDPIDCVSDLASNSEKSLTSSR